MKTISIFGSTGSIGKTTIQVLKSNPDLYKIRALTASSNVELLIEQAIELDPEYVVIIDENMHKRLKSGLSGTNVKVLAGYDSLLELASVKCDIIMMAITGIAALKPTMNAIKAGSNIALANKEAIICAGKLMLDEAKLHDVKLIPVDSEHSAIYQALNNESVDSIHKIILTASGGPFRLYTKDQLKDVKLADALKHPNWNMGKKVTIDSSTMVNKSLELIEAHYLFNLSEEKIDILIHPESIIHGMVNFTDGNITAIMSMPNMSYSISYALGWPNRIHNNSMIDFTKITNLNFEIPDNEKWPALKLARDCIKSGADKASSIIFNSSNEVAVEYFMQEKIHYLDIVKIISKALDKYSFDAPNSIEDVQEIDKQVRLETEQLISEINAI